MWQKIKWHLFSGHGVVVVSSSAFNISCVVGLFVSSNACDFAFLPIYESAWSSCPSKQRGELTTTVCMNRHELVVRFWDTVCLQPFKFHKAERFRGVSSRCAISLLFGTFSGVVRGARRGQSLPSSRVPDQWTVLGRRSVRTGQHFSVNTSREATSEWGGYC